MKILLVGGGQIVIHLAKSLTSGQHKIFIINENEETCKILSNTYEAVSIHGDGTDPNILKEAKASEMDMVLALYNRDAPNLILCEIVKNQFHVKKTVSIVNDPNNIEVFNDLGIDFCLSTTRLLENLIERETIKETVQSYIPLEYDRIKIYEVILEDISPVINKKLWEINFPKGSLIGCIIRKDETIIPKGNIELKTGDRVIVLSSTDDEDNTVHLLTGLKEK